MSRYGDLTVYRRDLLPDSTARRMLVSVGPRGRYGGRPVKRRRTTWVPRYGSIPLIPPRLRGLARVSGNYGKYEVKGGSTASPELKFIDTILVASVVPTTGYLRPTVATDAVTPAVALAATGTLLQVVQGDQAYQRNGKNIVIKSISGRLNVALPPSAVGSDETTDVYRIMLVQDMQCNGAAPAVTDVISYPGQVLTEDSFNNLENNKRFRTLLDVWRPINATAGGIGAAAEVGSLVHCLKFNKKCNIPISYSTTATTGALATIKSNNIFVLAISALGTCTLSGQIRVRYSD